MDLGMKNIDSLSTIEKISLYNCLYKDLAGKGIDGDTELAHVNKEEMEVLRSMGGSGTINPHTNLIQFGGGGRQSAPTQTTQVQQTEFPTELKPFIGDIFGKAKAIQEKRETEGYTPFEGPRLAAFTPDQTTAFQGVRDTVGVSDPFFNRAAQLTEASSAAPTPESVGQFMNPYIQNVLDIERREARRDADTVGQQIAGRAARAGGFGGSREAILSAEHERDTARNLADIQSRGLASAFEDAQTRLTQQRARELGAGQQFANLGTTVPTQRLREIAALEGVGQTQQQRGQQAIDIAQQEFEIDRTFPERTLQDYSAILRGFSAPLPASTATRQSSTVPRSSFAQNAAGVAGLLGAAGKFKFKSGGKIGRYSNGELVGADDEIVTETVVNSPPNYRDPYQGIALSGLIDAMTQQRELSKLRQKSAATEKDLLAAQRARLEGGDKDELIAGLLRFASTDPSEVQRKGNLGAFAGAFADTPEKIKARQKEAEQLALQESKVDVKTAESDISDIQKQVTLITAVQKAAVDGDLTPKEAAAFIKAIRDGSDQDIARMRLVLAKKYRPAFDTLTLAGRKNIVEVEPDAQVQSAADLAARVKQSES
jgi:hypothetical protein